MIDDIYELMPQYLDYIFGVHVDAQKVQDTCDKIEDTSDQRQEDSNAECQDRQRRHDGNGKYDSHYNQETLKAGLTKFFK